MLYEQFGHRVRPGNHERNTLLPEDPQAFKNLMENMEGGHTFGDFRHQMPGQEVDIAE